MKTFRLLLLATLTTLRAADVPDVDEGKPLASRITDVTVFADRAQVTRTANIELTAETARVAFAKLPGWIDEGSVRVALTPVEAGQVLDVQIRRAYLTKASDEDFRKAEAAVRDVADRLGALDDEKAVLEAQAKHLDAIRAFSLDKLPRDVALRETSTTPPRSCNRLIASTGLRSTTTPSASSGCLRPCTNAGRRPISRRLGRKQSGPMAGRRACR